MGVARFASGALVRLHGEEYKVLRMVSETCWQMEQTRTRRIKELQIDEVQALLGERALVFLNTSPRLAPQAIELIQTLTAEQMETAKVRLAYVREVMQLPNTKLIMEPIIANIWSRIQKPPKAPSFVSVYRWKREYSLASKDIRALVDQDQKKGNRSPRFPDIVREICEASIDEVYMRRERNTIDATLTVATERVRRENEQRLATQFLPKPTRRLVARLIRQRPEFDKRVARYGHENARHYFRTVKKQQVSDRPLQRAEIDHTRLDLFVLDDREHLPLGRPNVTACIDSYTRSILGVSVSFTPPSYQSVMECLEHCILPKAGLRKKFSSIAHDWHAYGIMKQLVMDNGREFHSGSLENLCERLGIEQVYAPRREPWFKGKIERFFGTLNSQLSHTLPGTTFSNIFEKDDYDPAEHAVVTMSQLQELLHKWIVDVYHQQTHRSLQTSPASLWSVSIRPEDIELPDDSVDLPLLLEIGRAHV